MNFDRGIVARINIKETLCNRKETYWANNAKEVFDIISDKFSEENAIEASAWAELATIGEYYEVSGFEIMIEEG